MAVDRAFFIDNVLIRIHFIIEMIWWTGLVPWFEFPFPGSLISIYLHVLRDGSGAVPARDVRGEALHQQLSVAQSRQSNPPLGALTVVAASCPRRPNCACPQGVGPCLRAMVACLVSSVLLSSLELSDTQVYEPEVQALLGTKWCLSAGAVVGPCLRAMVGEWLYINNLPLRLPDHLQKVRGTPQP